MAKRKRADRFVVIDGTGWILHSNTVSATQAAIIMRAWKGRVTRGPFQIMKLVPAVKGKRCLSPRKK